MLPEETEQYRNQTIHQLVKRLFCCPCKRKPWACAPYGPAFRRVWRFRRPLWRSVIQTLTFVALTLYVTSCLPRPDWLVCDAVASPPRSTDRNSSHHGVYGMHSRSKVVDPSLRGVLRMFTVYNETLTEVGAGYTKSETPGWETDDVAAKQDSRLKIIPSFDFKLIRDYVAKQDNVYGNSHNGVLLPECVHFVGPQEMKSPTICIHPPDKDKVISMVLRDSGTWELDRLIDMEWTLQAYTDMQLVDLGCNVGVFTLYAAGLGRHVLAVDASPSNLRLLQASLTINDHQNTTYAVLRNTTHMYPARQKSSTLPEKTTAANSVNLRKNRTRIVSNQFPSNKAQKDKLIRSSNANGTFKDKYKIKRKYRNKYKKPRMSRKLLQINKSLEPNISTANRLILNSTTVMPSITNKYKVMNTNSTYPTVKRNNTLDEQHTSRGLNENVPTDIFKISQLVTLVQNAVYSDRTSRLALYLKPDGNVGGAEIVPINSRLLEDESGDTVFVDSVCLDDLLPLVKAPSVYLKMDIEGSEPHVLKCAQKFFEKVHVRFVLMEWLFQLRSTGSSRPLAHEMIRFFTAKGFIPTTGAGVDVRGGAGENRGVNVLDVNEWNRWPETVLWMER